MLREEFIQKGYQPIPVDIKRDQIGRLGHVDHIRFRGLYMQAQSDFLAGKNLSVEALVINNHGLPVVVEATVQHQKPLKEGPAEVLTRVDHIGRASIAASHLLLDSDGNPASTARYIFVMRGLDGNSVPVDDTLRRLFIPEGGGRIPMSFPGDRSLLQGETDGLNYRTASTEIDYSMIGPFGHLDHQQYPELLQDAQFKWLDEAGLSAEALAEAHLIPVIVFSTIRHSEELLAGAVEVDTAVDDIRYTRFNMHHRVRKVGETEAVTIAKYRYSMVDESEKPVKMPDEVVAALGS